MDAAESTPLAPERLGFRPLAAADLPLLLRWRRTPHVARWWYEAEPITPEWVAAKYTPCIEGAIPTRCFIILYAAAPIGFIQTYRLADYPDYARCLDLDDPDEAAAGLDLFIGEASCLHRGLGAPLLRHFLREIMFAAPDIVSCIIGPEPTNTAAIRAYAKAGFTYLKTVQCPDEPEPEYLMRLTRAELDAGAGGAQYRS